MGSGYSQEENERVSLVLYESSLKRPCVFPFLFPDVGIDETLLRYSGTNSNAELQAYSDELRNSVPDYIDKLGSNLAPFDSVSNAVGLAALVISMILEIIMKKNRDAHGDTYGMVLRVFGEEKGYLLFFSFTELYLQCNT